MSSLDVVPEVLSASVVTHGVVVNTGLSQVFQDNLCSRKLHVLLIQGTEFTIAIAIICLLESVTALTIESDEMRGHEDLTAQKLIILLEIINEV